MPNPARTRSGAATANTGSGSRPDSTRSPRISQVASRRHHTLPRDLEFATATELAKRMGCPAHLWLRAAVKEVVDNALDAAEEADRSPVITVTADPETGAITIEDNGPGLAPEVVASIATWTQRTSSREAYAAPDRGALGNALQTVSSLPLGLGEDSAATAISSRGVLHTITMKVNRLAGRVEVEHQQEPAPTPIGAKIGIRWPQCFLLDEIESVLGDVAAFNPHAAITLNGEERWPRRGAIRKWLPGQPTPAHWYTAERFAHRIRADLRNDPQVTVAQFLGAFKGLTDRSRRARVAEAADLSGKPLASLLDASGMDVDAERAERLLSAMQEASTPPKIEAALGGIGKNQARALFASDGDQSPESDLPGFAYAAIEGGDIPWRWELAFAPGKEDEHGRPLEWVGHNFTTLVDPEQLREVIPTALRYFTGPYRLFVHRISPARATNDYGKSRIALQFDEIQAVRDGLNRLTEKWIERRKAAAAREYRGRSRPEPAARREISIRDAVFRLLPEAYGAASSGGAHAVRSRQIFYSIRPKVLELTGATTLGDQYFSTQLLPEYLQEHPDATRGWRVLFDARGTLIEPHTRHQVPVGTAGVTTYQNALRCHIPFSAGYGVAHWDPDTRGPGNRYSAVIVVEKEGIADLLHSSGVAERFDVAILGLKGQPTEAALKIIDGLGLPTFLLHDFDRAGLTIAANLREGTWRHRHANAFPVIDVGLRIDQIEGLESEPIDRKNLKSVGDDRLRECRATEPEIEFLRRRRVELNALTTAALVEMVEAALVEHGVTKVIPAAADLANAWRSAMAAAEVDLRLQEVCAEIEERWRRAAPPPMLRLQLREALLKDPGKAWDSVLSRLAYDHAAQARRRELH